MNLHKSGNLRRNPATLAGSVVYSGAMDAKTRVRQRIKRLLDDRGRTQHELAQELGHGDQWASNLLAGRHALSWEDLDRVATFLKVPPSELVRVSDEPWELSPSEMRVVRALRMLPPTVRDHLVTLADYLIGATPEEVELLKRVRQLTADELRRIEHYMDVELLSRGTAPSQANPSDLRVTNAQQVRRVRDSRNARTRSRR